MKQISNNKYVWYTVQCETEERKKIRELVLKKSIEGERTAETLLRILKED